MTMRKQVDRVYRLAYRLAYPVARRWWRLSGHHYGVAIAVWLGDTVLAVHHSYKPGLRLPGGGVGWREDHHQAAVRELREEVGVTLDPAQLRLVASNPRGSFHLYEARIEAMPELVIDRRVITDARFVPPMLLYEMGFRSRVGAYLRDACDRRNETEATKAANPGLSVGEYADLVASHGTRARWPKRSAR
jgi:8-oxo-dGTP pyrophosphatase MutT (NUDIX family)